MSNKFHVEHDHSNDGCENIDCDYTLSPLEMLAAAALLAAGALGTISILYGLYQLFLCVRG